MLIHILHSSSEQMCNTLIGQPEDFDAWAHGDIGPYGVHHADRKVLVRVKHSQYVFQCKSEAPQLLALMGPVAGGLVSVPHVFLCLSVCRRRGDPTGFTRSVMIIQQLVTCTEHVRTAVNRKWKVDCFWKCDRGWRVMMKSRVFVVVSSTNDLLN